MLGVLPRRFEALNANAYRFEVPDGATELARGPVPQGFRVDGSAWGVQFHPEVRRDQLLDWFRDEPTLPRPLDELAAELDDEARGLAGARACALPRVPRGCGLQGERQVSSGRSSSARPLVPRADVVARVIAERPQQLGRDRRPAAAVAVGDDLDARLDAERRSDLGRIELQQPVDVEMPRAGDVTLPWVAPLAGGPVVLLHRANVDDRRPRRAGRRAPRSRSPSQRAHDRDLGRDRRPPLELLEPLLRCAGAARRRGGRAPGSPTGRRPRRRRGSAPPRAPRAGRAGRCRHRGGRRSSRRRGWRRSDARGAEPARARPGRPAAAAAPGSARRGTP